MKLFVLLVLMVLATPVSAEYITRTEDADGWTVLTPSVDTQIVYVAPSASGGNNATCASVGSTAWNGSGDPYNPDAGEYTPCEDIDTALTKVTSGDPDWILFLRGQTYTDDDSYWINNPPSGDNADEPFVIGSYGTSGASPIIKTGTQMAIRITTATEYLVFMGLDFYADDRNPDDGGGFVSGDLGIWIYDGSLPLMNVSILIEGCRFRWYRSNVIEADVGGIYSGWYIIIRRSRFEHNWDGSSHSQGIYSAAVGDILFEENILYHNGWYQQSILGDDSKTNGQATEKNHNLYWGSMGTVEIRENMIIDGSSAGLKMTGYLDNIATNIEDNLFIGNEYAISVGNNYRSNDYRFPDFILIDNVFSNTGRGDHNLNNTSTGIWVGGLDNSTISNNLFINQANVSNGQAINFLTDVSRDVAVSSNIIFNVGVTDTNYMSDLAGSSNIVFSDNDFQNPDISNNNIVRFNYAPGSEMSFTNNNYYADSTTWLNNGATVSSLSAWNALSYVGTDTWGETAFTDDTRDVDTYHSTVMSGTGTVDAFITSARAQDRWSWDPDLNVADINDWIRTGFDLEQFVPDLDDGTTTSSGVGGTFSIIQ